VGSPFGEGLGLGDGLAVGDGLVFGLAVGEAVGAWGPYIRQTGRGRFPD